jgi:hypothetical protein
MAKLKILGKLWYESDVNFIFIKYEKSSCSLLLAFLKKFKGIDYFEGFLLAVIEKSGVLQFFLV